MPPPYFSTLSLHDALPIWCHRLCRRSVLLGCAPRAGRLDGSSAMDPRQPQLLEPGILPDLLGSEHQLARAARSEEHTSELQSLRHLVCRLLLEKKKKNKKK